MNRIIDRYVCRCRECENARLFRLLDALQAVYGCKTVAQAEAVLRTKERMDT